VEVDISNNGGTTWVTIDHREGIDPNADWTLREKSIHTHFPVLDQFRLRVVMYGHPYPSIDEGGLDEFLIMTGTGPVSDVEETSVLIPLQLNLASRNPDVGPRRLSYGLSGRGQVRLRVVDVGGRVVSTLVDAVQPAGLHEASWHGRDSSGRPVSSGVYFIQLLTPEGNVTKRIVMLR
jgi:hypothetical protein